MASAVHNRIRDYLGGSLSAAELVEECRHDCATDPAACDSWRLALDHADARALDPSVRQLLQDALTADSGTKLRAYPIAEQPPHSMSPGTLFAAPASLASDEGLQVIDRRFVLEARLGGGGMGIVYRARDRLMEEQQDPDPYVALKVMSDAIRDNPDGPIALQREGRRAQALSHPNIVRVFHFGRDAETYYLTMELLRGRSLDEVLRANPSGLPLVEAAPIIRQLCSALAYAHTQGIVHSDIKPNNVFLTDGGVVKVLDFGIAAPLRSAAGGRETRFNPRRLGALSPKYASMEMYLGLDADPRDDVYSVGCVIHELLTGRHPYDGEEAPRALDRNMRVKPIASLSETQNAALIQALSLKRDERTASLDELSDALLHGAVSMRSKLARHALPAAIAVVTAVILGGAGWYWIDRSAEPDGRAAETRRAGEDISPARGGLPPVAEPEGNAPPVAEAPPADAPLNAGSPGDVCARLEADWNATSCADRRRCYTQFAADAQVSASIAPPDLTPIYEARERMFRRLSSAACSAMSTVRDTEYGEFRRQFPGSPLH